MANINLLPWREWERERKQKEFLVNLAAVVILAVVMLLAAGEYLKQEVENQKARNQYYESKIAVLDERIKEISTLREDREELLERMRVIQQLQGNRPIIVRVFDELVQTLSEGVHYTQLEMKDGNLALEGVAESNNRISALMRNVDNSEWFAEPNLKSIKEDDENRIYGTGASLFDLTFRQVNPADDGTEEDN